MLKRFSTLLLAIIFALTILPTGQLVEASATYTFVKANYTETEGKNGDVTRTLNSVTLKNSAGKTATFNLGNTGQYYINNTLTTIDGFKAGMSVTIKLNLGRITEMRSSTNEVGGGSIIENSKQLTGVVTELVPNGLQIRVKLDGSATRTFTVTKNTDVFKAKSVVDLTALYVGDRVQLTFATANTSTIAEINIMNTANMVEELYKASLNLVNTNKNTLNVKNAHPLLNWLYGTKDTEAQATFNFTNNTSIYVGNKKISKNDLKNYRNSELYFVTKKQFSKEVIEKIIVLNKNERTYYQPITQVNVGRNFFQLNNSLNLRYHNGSILIRNGRIVEPEGLIALNQKQTPISTTAYVLTDGAVTSEYAHIVNITNDAFIAPNISRNYELYFGRIHRADRDGYQVTLSDLERFDNHFWNTTNQMTEFAFSNSTIAYEWDVNRPLKVIPKLDLDLFDSYTNSPNPFYSYFYMKDGHIQGIYFVPYEKRASLTLTGQVGMVNPNKKELSVKNSSQWGKDGHWNFTYSALTLDLTKAMIVKNGKVIKIDDIKKSDHVTAIARSTSEVYVLMVNE